MNIQITTDPVPLRIDQDEVIRVSNTRVTLYTVVKAFNEGSFAEEIVADYPSLNLADVYSVISFYLNRRDEIDRYLHERSQQAIEIRQQNKKRFSSSGIRERLLARRHQENTLERA